MSALSPYSLALLLNEGSFSCVKAAQSLGFVSHDALTRSLLKRWRDPGVINWDALPKSGVLVVDDTVIAKPHSEHISHVVWTYDSSEGHVVRGISFLLALWISDGRTHVISVSFPGTENRQDLLEGLLRELKAREFEVETVLMDAWYGSSRIFNLIQSFGWTYVSRAKGNRLFNGQGLQTFRFEGARSRTGKLNGVKHRVQVVKHHDRYLVTNELTPHTSRTLADAYQKRWVIETVFRALKSVLHLEKCSCRSVDAQISHVLSSLEAFLYLQREFPGPSTEAAQQEMLHRYRCKTCRPELIQLVTA